MKSQKPPASHPQRARFIDADELESGSPIHCDVCIVGSGPAGMTVASELADSRIGVCLVEGGGLSYTVRAATVAEQLELAINTAKLY